MEILYEDGRVIAVVKPAGVLSDQVPALLRQQTGSECFRTVHRLDGQVGGVMVLARSAKAASLLGEQIRRRAVEKEYLAVVEGEPPAEGRLTDLLGRDSARRVTYVSPTPGKDVREAALTYCVLARCNGLSLVSISLETGRTHQIRVQFASRGWPVWGDGKYGTARPEGTIALWCRRMAFAHPQSGERMAVSALPQGTPWGLFADAMALLQAE